MLIHLERSGGFAGMKIDVTLDTESLTEEYARKIKEMLDSSDFFNMPPTFAPPKRGADFFNYRITAKLEGKEHTVEMSDPQVPDGLRALLQSVMKYARK
jgi:hypothetical protein